MWTLLLGFDAFDPTVFERLSEKGKLPHLTRYVEIGGYARLAVANPPQTEVSWTSIATGSNPGGHGIFDFVHRDPATYTPYLSLLPTKTSPFGTRFVPPYKARTIFEETTRQGFPATVLWWPATFPARPELPVRALPGLGTPDVKGRWGVGTLFASDAGPDRLRNVAVVALARRGTDRYAGSLAGPSRKSRGSTNQSALDVQIDLIDDGSAHVAMGDQTVELIKGRWSPVLVMRFKVGRLVRIHALARLILTHTRPHVRLYVSPLQIVPMRSPWRYATPRAFVKQVWSSHGPFLTLGWPQDTTALEEGCIADSQFLDLCESVFTIRERILLSQLEQFNEGILASIFDSLDRVQHMFRRSRPGIVDDWYVRLDGLVG